MCSLCFVLFAIAARRGLGTRTSSGDTSRVLTLLSRGATLRSFSPPGGAVTAHHISLTGLAPVQTRETQAEAEEAAAAAAATHTHRH